MPTLPKILIVDDEPFNVDYLEQELELLDCECVRAANGAEALDKVKTEVPDLVLLDIMMPLMDGFEVLTRMKADPTTHNIPVIIISASSDLGSVARGIQLGAEDYLPKPFEPTLLHARVSSSLEKKHLYDLQKLHLKSLERELEIAREIQLTFLPARLPELEGWDIAAYFKAAREVAGDFYDAFLLPGNQLMFFVGDVCGKGVGAALFMTLYRSLIRAAATTRFFVPGGQNQVLSSAERLLQVVSFANSYIASTHEDAKFATAFIGLVDMECSKLTYMNCGNEPAFLVRSDGSLTKLSPNGPVIGLFLDAKFKTGEVSLGKDDLLLAYTDGITDTMNRENSSFGKDNLARILKKSEINCDLLLKEIVEQANNYAGDVEQFDDITMMALKRMR